MTNHYMNKVQEDSSKDIPDLSSMGDDSIDDIFGGGFPRGSIVLLAGSSGSGKTNFSFQWLFNGVSIYNENGLYITFTEPLFKILKNLEHMTYYNRSYIEEEKVKIFDIREATVETGFDAHRILSVIEKQVRGNDVQRLVLDSVTAIAYSLEDKATIRKFIFDLGTMLATLDCTAILTSEVVGTGYSVYGVEEFISDVIIKLSQNETAFQHIREIQIVKMRGRNYNSEKNVFKISKDGLIIFPKIKRDLQYESSKIKISTGVRGFDEMTRGGVFKGSSNILVGATGTGKSITSLHFIRKGLENHERCILISHEESKSQILRNAKSFGWDLEKYEEKGLLKILCSYPSEKYIEEHMHSLKNAVEDMEAQRCVIDSLSSLESTFPEDKFESFVKAVNLYLKGRGVTTFFTAATASLTHIEKLTQSHLSSITDNIFMLKYTEVDGQIKTTASVLKTRGDDHSRSIRFYDITKSGIIIGESLSGYEGIMTGSVRKVSQTNEEKLKDEFKKFIGPMAENVLMDIKRRGISKDNMINYIDELVDESILEKEDGESFKNSIISILNGAKK